MSCQSKIVLPNVSFAMRADHVSQIVFKDSYNASFMKRYASLFPGLSFAVAYKVLQRVYKFGGQPFAREFVAKTPVGPFFKSHLGEKAGRAMTEATAGCLIGIGEVALLPLDVLKIKAQTNPEVRYYFNFLSLAGRGFFDIIKTEGKSLYKGTGFTIMRNAPGSFALFGGNAFVKVCFLVSYQECNFKN